MKKSSAPEIDKLFGDKTSAELKAALTQVETLNGVFDSVDEDRSKGLDFTEFMAGAMLAGKQITDPTIARQKAEAIEKAYSDFFNNGCKTSGDVKNAVYKQCLDVAAAQIRAAYPGLSEEEVQKQAAAAVESQLANKESTAYKKMEQALTAWETRTSLRQCFEAAGGSDSHDLSRSEFAYAAALAGKNSTKDAASLKQLAELNEADPSLAKLLILEADTLNDKIDDLNDDLAKAKSQMDAILTPTADLAGSLAKICKELDDLDDLRDTADDFGNLGKAAAKKCSTILEQTDALYKILDGYEPKLQETLTTVKQLSESASATVRDTGTFMTDLEDLMKTSGQQLDDGTKQTLEGLAAVLRSAAKSMTKTNDVKSAKNNISSIIEDTWDEYTGDVNNLLLMDANADAESLTDSRNAAPTSVQVLIRTQEIKADKDGNSDVETVQPQQTTFWGRVAQMFKDLWAAVTGIFHKG